MTIIFAPAFAIAPAWLNCGVMYTSYPAINCFYSPIIGTYTLSYTVLM
ncbi:hypothetical protein [Nostoc sp.]